MSRPQTPIAWCIAGNDSGGGAGLQADLKACEAFDVHACTVVSAITAQNSTGVQAISAVDPAMLASQLEALAGDLPPQAIKVGMLGSVECLQVVARAIDRSRERDPGLPVVVDPVLRASTGARFADEPLLSAYRTVLLPRATLLTPNRSEAATLLGLPPLERAAEVEHAARALLECGAGAVAITGGDTAGAHSEDCIATPQVRGWLRLPRIDTPHHHGTGCVFASSAAAAMAHGFVEADALVLAKMATTEALRASYAAGAGAGPVRPRPGFALNGGNLARLMPWGALAGSTHFAALASRELGLYAIVDSADWVRRVLDAGIRTVQLRIKDAASSGLRASVRRSVRMAEAAGAQLFVNDHWHLAIEEGAYGVHLGQEDLARADLQAIAEAGLRLGVSTHAPWEVCRALAVGPSYIACGPIHPTAAKAMPWIPQGTENLAYWCEVLSQPVVAIGGMDTARAAEAMRCGAAGVAVISAITAAADPEGMAEVLQAAVASPGRRIAAPRWPRTTLASRRVKLGWPS